MKGEQKADSKNRDSTGAKALICTAPIQLGWRWVCIMQG